MSQNGLLTDDEIRNYMSENLGLKLDKDTFARPNKTTIFTIYAAFLDRIIPAWRKPRPGDKDEPNLKIRMYSIVMSLLRSYSVGYEFNLFDILKPMRKRTVTFLNVLIYIAAQLDDEDNFWKVKLESWEKNQAEAEKFKQSIESYRLRAEEAAISNANSEPLELIRKEISTKREHFATSQRKVESYAKEAENYKITLKSQTELVQNLQSKIKSIVDKREEYEKTLSALENLPGLKSEMIDKEQLINAKRDQLQHLRESSRDAVQKRANTDKNLAEWKTLVDTFRSDISADSRAYKELKQARADLELRERRAKMELDTVAAEEAILQKKLADINQAKSNNRVKDKIRQEQIRQELDKKLHDKNDLKIRHANEINKLEMTIEQKRKQKKELKVKGDAAHELCETLMSKSNNSLEHLEELVESKKKVLMLRISEIVSSQKQIESLMGSSDLTSISIAADRTYIPADRSYVPADRTYIKDSH